MELRKHNSCDAKVIVEWIKNEYAFRRWCADRYDKYPITADDMNHYYSKYSEDELYKLTAVCKGEIIGHQYGIRKKLEKSNDNINRRCNAHR